MMSGRRQKSNALALLLIGTFSMTEVNIIGWLGISELVMFLVAPVLFMVDYAKLRHDGFLPLIWLSLLMMASSVMSNVMNHNYFFVAMKGIAAVYSIFAITIVLHHLLRNDPIELRWLLLGIAISVILSTFIFQRGCERVSGGEVLSNDAATEAVMSYSLYWANLLRRWVELPIDFSYLSLPSGLTAAIVAFIALFALFNAGGRSAFAVSVFACALVLIGGRESSRMKLIKKHILVMGVLFVLLGAAIGKTYKILAKSGALGERQYEKYMNQTKAGEGMLNLLMAGRADFFACLIAAKDRPIIGYGAWPIDVNDYWGHFLNKYGAPEDFAFHEESLRNNPTRVRRLPGHSQILTGWTWHGIGGLVFWLYVAYLYGTVLKNHLAAIPHMYGYFCLALPTCMWALLFSPFGNRISVVSLIVMCVFAKQVGLGRFSFVHKDVVIGKMRGNFPRGSSRLGRAF